MKLQELNATEMKEINGGGLFSSNSDSQSSNGFAGSLGIGNLFSSSSHSSNGDQSSSSSYSAGNGIDLNLGGIFESMSRSL